MSGAPKLDLRPGEWIEVKSEAEILATLDENAALDGLPFMPEMLPHCGQRFQVFKRADKTCDTVSWTGLRGMENTVHLKMLRCDGSAHGGCQAGCLMFWKEAWLRCVTENNGHHNGPGPCVAAPTTNGAAGSSRNHGWLQASVYRAESSETEPLFRCQATEINRASTPLPWWKPRQYVRDVRMNAVPLWEVLRGITIAAYSKFRRLLTGHPYPYVAGTLKRTPAETLELRPGEWVVVKSKEEILATLDGKGRNRGMTFDVEMLPYCGQKFRVLRRVERLIEESTGRLIEPAGVSIILENAVCMARYRRSCPRSIFPYWREIWLRRAESNETNDAANCNGAVGSAAPVGVYSQSESPSGST